MSKDGTKISDALIYFAWAHQGAIMDNVSFNEETDAMVVHISIPSHSYLKDRNGEELASDNLKRYLYNTIDIVKTAALFNQGIVVDFEVEEREDHWNKESSYNAVEEMMERMFFGNPFMGVS